MPCEFFSNDSQRDVLRKWDGAVSMLHNIIRVGTRALDFFRARVPICLIIACSVIAFGIGLKWNQADDMVLAAIDCGQGDSSPTSG